jgi:hypothetical protein
MSHIYMHYMAMLWVQSKMASASCRAKYAPKKHSTPLLSTIPSQLVPKPHALPKFTPMLYHYI